MNDTIALPPNTLAGRGIGDNHPPLHELLGEELKDDKARADELLAAASQARLESTADAGKVADLILLIRDHERALDAARDVRKRPYLRDCRIIDAAYGHVIGPLTRARTDTLAPMLEEWRQEHPDEMLPASIASVGSRRKSEWVIEDLPAALAWLLNERPGDIAQSCRTIIGSIINRAGVDAVERGEVRIPGVSITLAKTLQVR